MVVLHIKQPAPEWIAIGVVSRVKTPASAVGAVVSLGKAKKKKEPLMPLTLLLHYDNWLCGMVLFRRLTINAIYCNSSRSLPLPF